MKRFILTGTPGCGKTSILNALEARGYAVVGEAATDLIAMDQAQGGRSPWTKAGFLERVVALQKQRQLRASGEVAFFDRSPICTCALAIYLGVSPPPPLVLELERLRDQRIYDSEVFFIRNLGFCEPTPARQMTYSDRPVSPPSPRRSPGACSSGSPPGWGDGERPSGTRQVGIQGHGPGPGPFRLGAPAQGGQEPALGENGLR